MTHRSNIGGGPNLEIGAQLKRFGQDKDAPSGLGLNQSQKIIADHDLLSVIKNNKLNPLNGKSIRDALPALNTARQLQLTTELNLIEKLNPINSRKIQLKNLTIDQNRLSDPNMLGSLTNSHSPLKVKRELNNEESKPSLKTLEIRRHSDQIRRDNVIGQHENYFLALPTNPYKDFSTKNKLNSARNYAKVKE